MEQPLRHEPAKLFRDTSDTHGNRWGRATAPIILDSKVLTEKCFSSKRYPRGGYSLAKKTDRAWRKKNSVSQTTVLFKRRTSSVKIEKVKKKKKEKVKYRIKKDHKMDSSIKLACQLVKTFLNAYLENSHIS